MSQLHTFTKGVSAHVRTRRDNQFGVQTLGVGIGPTVYGLGRRASVRLFQW
ncbi:hypothetical protein [Alicyclobacillus tolerans]|uniref:Uncharacterized protein n=1 Tax=Alicyclobacillus tolerans TaxID=90970 RepID=A0A1M6UMG7_9BACL|nr:hypothetical protein [Alicyclobacillus montanus]SHK70465.1 hypothetical protein SAMN05443507_12038 [Alicyclobacillus montanus]